MGKYKHNRFIISKNNPIIKKNYQKLNDLLDDYEQEKNKIIVHKSKNVSLNFNGSQLGNSFNINDGHIFLNGKNRGNIQTIIDQSQYSYIVVDNGLKQLLSTIRNLANTRLLVKYRPYSIPVSNICHACQNIIDNIDNFMNMYYIYDNGVNSIGMKRQLMDIQHISLYDLMLYALSNIITILNTCFQSSDRIDLFLLFCAGIHPFNLSVMNSLNQLTDTCSIYKNELAIMGLQDKDKDPYTLLDIYLTRPFINKYCFYKSEFINGFVIDYVFTIVKFLIQLIDHQDSCYIKIAEPSSYKCFNNDSISIRYQMSPFGKLKYGKGNWEGRNLLRNSNQTISNTNYLIAEYDFGFITPAPGDTITITIWGTLGSNTQSFKIYNSTPSCLIKTLASNTSGNDNDGQYWSGQSPWTLTDSRGNTVPNNKILVYAYPANNGGTASTIRKISLTIGNSKYDYEEAPEDQFYVNN